MSREVVYQACDGAGLFSSSSSWVPMSRKVCETWGTPLLWADLANQRTDSGTFPLDIWDQFLKIEKYLFSFVNIYS